MTNTEFEFSPAVLPTSDTAPTIGLRGTLAAVALREGPGTRIGLYKLVEQLGEGGFADTTWPRRCPSGPIKSTIYSSIPLPL